MRQSNTQQDSQQDEFSIYRQRQNPTPRQSTTRPVRSVVRSTEEDRIEGVIRNIRQDRGFGFIAGDNGTDFFFHWSGLEKTTRAFKELEQLDRVSFIPIDGDKGPRAICIRLV